MAEIKGVYAAGVSTIDAQSNIGFKLGYESKLTDASFRAENGVFYLTRDTHRLFIGNNDHSISPVNQGVIEVTSLPPQDGIIPGQFYYLKNDNILATFNGTQWVQINPDTQVSGIAHSATENSADGKVTVNTTVSQVGGSHSNIEVLSNNIVIKGKNDIVVTVDSTDNAITIADADYSFATAGNENEVKFNLMRDPAESTGAADRDPAVESSVTFTGIDGIDITQTAGNIIKVSAAEAMNAIAGNDVQSLAFTNEAEDGFKLTLTKSNGDDSVTATVHPQIKYGSTEITVPFKNGVADIDVYTIEEINNKIDTALRSFNALTYRGTVGGAGSTANFIGLPTGTGSDAKNLVNVGDVFMSDGSYTHEGSLTDPGTLFIARGEEDALTGYIKPATLEWTQVQNYSTDTRTLVSTTPNTNAIIFDSSVMKNGGVSETEHLGSFKVVGDEDDLIVATETFSDPETKKDKVITVTHTTSEKYVHTDSPAGGTDETAVLYTTKALGAIGLDKWNHVVSSVDTTIEVPTEIFEVDDNSVAVAKTTVTTTATATVTGAPESKMTGTLSDQITLKSSGGAPISTVHLNQMIASETLTLAADTNGALKMDLMWGEF